VSAHRLDVIVQRELGVSSPIILDKEQRPSAGCETEERIARIAAGLQRLGRARFVPAETPDGQLDGILGSVHSREYLEFLSSWSERLAEGDMRVDKLRCAPGVEADTPIVKGIYRVAREGVRTALAAARHVAGGGRFAYALCRPPGHHAGFDWLGGYCYLNNAVAAARALLNTGIERVAVVDFDHHFGNGSAALVERTPEIFYGSVHSSTEISYPYMKTQSPNTRQVYVPFAHAPSPREFLSGIDRLLAEALKFGCSAIVVSAGYDVVDGDPHGTWHLPPAVLQEVGMRLSQTAVPLCVIQEGGYLLPKLDECSFRFGLGLLGGDNGGTTNGGA
jgi:acetoin utilization deacetylase AcuC-like enzyme